MEADKKILAEEDSELTEKISNVIENVNYVGTSGSGLFEINAATAKIKYDEPNVSHLQDVFVIIKMGNRTFNIRSDKAIFNKLTSDGQFWGRVKVTEQDNILTSDNLDLFMSKNLITAYNNLNVKYNGIEQVGFLTADKVNVDILKNEADIFMFEKNDKIKVKYKN